MPANATQASAYVCAHPDDWQLFMNMNAYSDLVLPQTAVIFVQITAGDAGKPDLFWQSREAGAKSSIRFPLAPLQPVDEPLQESEGVVQVNGHPVTVWQCMNNSYYFMRVPDGAPDGNGFPSHNNESVTKLRSIPGATVTTVDGSTTYQSWNDLVNTINSIIATATAGLEFHWINYQDPDPASNPGDHADHAASGNAAQELPVTSNLSRALFVDYALINDPADLTGAMCYWKVGMFAAYEKGVYDGFGHSTIGESQSYVEWCLRSAHFRTVG